MMQKHDKKKETCSLGDRGFDRLEIRNAGLSGGVVGSYA